MSKLGQMYNLLAVFLKRRSRKGERLRGISGVGDVTVRRGP